MFRTLVAVLAVTLAAMAPQRGAAQGMFDDNVARTRIEELRKQLEERIAKVEAAAADRRALLDVASQLDALRGEISRLRGQVEVMQNLVQTSDKRGKDLYVDIDTRLRKLEQARETAAAAVEKPPAETSPPAAETKAYEAALNQFKLGNYPLAVSAFQGFLVTYPSSKLAPSAQYWIGNAHVAQRDYKQAIAAHQRVISAWAEDARAPEAMASIASSQEALGDRRGAQKTLEALVLKYPASPAAASAKQRLAQGTKK